MITIQELIVAGDQALVNDNYQPAEYCYVTALKKAYGISTDLMVDLNRQNNTQNYEVQIECFCKLACLYDKKADYLHAAAIYNYALAVCEKQSDFIIDWQTKRLSIQHSISQMEVKFLHLLNNDKENNYSYKTVVDNHKAKLRQIRQNCERDLNEGTLVTYKNGVYGVDNPALREVEDPSSWLNYLRMDMIYRYNYERITAFIASLLEECLSILADPPCDYAIISLGSLGRGEATPYSDLEFAILIQEDNETNRNYFRMLTKLLFLKLINLGETTPRTLYIKSLLDIPSPVPNGLSIDGQVSHACKTPLGNMHIDTIPIENRFELIKTPHAMIEYHDETWFKRHRHLSTVLYTVGFIYGKESLMNEYNDLVHAKFTESLRKQRFLASIPEIIGKFDTNLQVRRAEVFNIKHDFYRLPQLLFDLIAMHSDSRAGSLMTRLDKAQADHIFSNINSAQLRKFIDLVWEIRLRNYLRANEQDDRIILLSGASVVQNISKLLQIKSDVFMDLYHYIIPFYKALEELLNNNGDIRILYHYNFYDNTRVMDAYICEKLFEYERAIAIYQELYEQHANLVAELTMILMKQDTEDTYVNECINKTAQHSYTVEFMLQQIVRLLLKFGLSTELTRAVEKLKKTANPPFARMGADKFLQQLSVLLIAEVYILQGKKMEFGSIIKEILREPFTPKIQIEAFRLIASAYLTTTESEPEILARAIKNSESALRTRLNISVKTYGENSPYVALAYRDLAKCYIQDGNIANTLQAYQHALDIYFDLYDEIDLNQAAIFDELSNIHAKREEYHEAICYVTKLYNIYHKLHHPELAVICSRLKQYQERIEQKPPASIFFVSPIQEDEEKKKLGNTIEGQQMVSKPMLK